MKKITLLVLLAFGSFTLWSSSLFAADLATTATVQAIETGAGETKTFSLGKTSSFEAGPETRFAFVQNDTKGTTEKLGLSLEKGDVQLRVKADPGKRVQVKIATPNLVAKASAGEFQVSHDASLDVSQVRVTKGTITVTDEKGKSRTLVRKGFETFVDENGKPTKPVKIIKSAPATTAKSDAPAFATFSFGTGVSAEDEAIIRKGTADMGSYLMKWFGRTITDSTAVKTTADASDETCCNVGGAGSDSKISFHTKHTEWIQAKLAAFLFTDLRQMLVLHEPVHTYQTQYGCGRQDQPVALRWMNEGMAEWLAFRAMIEMGVVTESKVMDFNKFMVRGAKAETLSAYEVYHKGIDYSVFYFAVDQLMKKSPIASLSDFCEDLGKGQSKTDAFKSAFGTSLSQFYTDFEGFRKGL
jgi:hypothetical protein